MKRTYLNEKGEVVNKLHKQIGASWSEMNNLWVTGCTKEEKEYLNKYGLKTTIFNVANLRKHKHIFLTEHHTKVVLENGAKDKRN